MYQQISTSYSPLPKSTQTHFPLNFIKLLFFLKITSESISHPILPFFAQNELKLTSFELTISISVFSICQYISHILFGKVVDVMGSRFPVLFLTLMSCVSYLYLSYTHTRYDFILSRMCVGLCSSCVSLIHSMIHDITHTNERTVINRSIRGILSLGFLVGPIIGGVCSYTHTERRVCIQYSSISSLFIFFVSLFVLPETHTHYHFDTHYIGSSNKSDTSERSPLTNDVSDIHTHTNSSANIPTNSTPTHNNNSTNTRGNPHTQRGWEFYVVILLRFVLSSSSACLNGTYPALLFDHYHDNSDLIMAAILISNGVMIFIYQEYFFPLLYNHINIYAILAVSFTLQAITLHLIFTTITHTIWIHILIYSCLYNFGFTMAEQSLTQITFIHCGQSTKGSTPIMITQSHVCANILATPIFGYLYLYDIYLPFLLTSILVCLLVIIEFILFQFSKNSHTFLQQWRKKNK